MTERNGHHESATSHAARSINELAHDAITLAQLQTRLLQTEARDWFHRVLRTLVMLVVGACLLLASLPIVLFSLAYVLIEYAGWSHTASFLTAAMAGAGTAAALIAIGWKKLRNSPGAFARTREEVSRNAEWLKRMLKSPAGQATRTAPEHSESTF